MSGALILRHSAFNKGQGFTEEERTRLHIRGLVAPRVQTLELQVQRAWEQIQNIPLPLDKFVFMQELQNTNETVFYALLLSHLNELVPIVYTPVVGAGCQNYHKIFRRTRGMYLSLSDRGRLNEVVANWPERDVRVIVVTDGERILGLGDLGVNGMGIPVGKLVLYTACAGIHPRHVLPVTLDVGTNNEKLRQDPLYMGLNQPRLRGQEYDDFVKEALTALHNHFHVMFYSPLDKNYISSLTKFSFILLK